MNKLLGGTAEAIDFRAERLKECLLLEAVLVLVSKLFLLQLDDRLVASERFFEKGDFVCARRRDDWRYIIRK